MRTPLLFKRGAGLAVLVACVLGAPRPAPAADLPADPPPPPAASPPAAPEGAAPPSDVQAAPPAAPPPGDEVAERLREAEKRIDRLETAASLQRLQWSAEYRTIVSSFKYHGPSPDGARNPDFSPRTVDLSNAEQWLHRVRLNVRAEPIESLRFTGRLTMYKRFGSNTATPFPQDSSETRIPRDNGLRLERAWLDWFVTKWLALSVGRISYTDGPPNELKDNRTQPDATWGMQMVDGEYDTADVTVRVGERFLARGFYASWAFPRQDDLFSNFLFLNNGTDNLRIVGGNFDARLKELGAFVQLGAFVVPEFRPFSIPIPSPSPSPNPTNAPPPFNGGYLFPSSMPASLGSYSNFSVLAMFKNIASSGLDLFASGAIGILDPNGAAIAYPLGPNGAAAPLMTLASADADDHTTYFFFGGGRYTMPFGEALAPKLGFEFNHGSRYMISFAAPTSNLTNKLANRGNAYEGYYIQPINEHLFLRLSYSYIDTQYSGGFFGPSARLFPPLGGTAPAVDQHLHTLSLLLDARF
jgi:hypothetical protein